MKQFVNVALQQLSKLMNRQHFGSGRTKENGLLVLLLLIAAVIRFVAAYTLSLSNDELSALTRTRFASFSEMIQDGVYIDFHPAGVQTFLFYWVRIFGDNDFVFRLPFVLIGIGSLFLMFIIAKKWLGGFAAWFTLIVFSVFQYSILYSIYARPYVPGLFFGLLACYSWSQILFEKGFSYRRGWWILFILSMSACLHIHYFSIVFAAGLGIAGLFFIRERKLWIRYLISGLIILITFIPEWNIFLVQFGQGDIGGWLGAPSKTWLFDFLSYTLNDIQYLIFAVLSFALAGLFIVIAQRSWIRWHTLTIYLFLFSFLIAFLYSIFRHPVIQYSTLFFAFPFLLMILGAAVAGVLKNIRTKTLFLFAIMVTGTIHTVFVKQVFSKAPFGVFENISEDIALWNNKAGNNNLSGVVNVINPEYMKYYFRKVNYSSLDDIYKVETAEACSELIQKLDTLQTEYFYYAWTNSIHPPAILAIIRDYYPVMEEKKVYFNSAAYLFSKSGENSGPTTLWRQYCDYDKHCWNEAVELKEKENAGNNYKMVSAEQEYASGLEYKVEQLPITDYAVLHAKIRFRCESPNPDVLLVLSIERDTKVYEYKAASFAAYKLPGREWSYAYVSAIVPGDYAPGDLLKLYCWNRGRVSFSIDDWEIRLDKADDPYKYR